jgi:hypothetical protein
MKRYLIAVVMLAIAGCATAGGGATFTGPISDLVGKSTIVPIPQLLAQAITSCAKNQTSGNALAVLDYNGWVQFCTGQLPQPPITLSQVGQIGQDTCRVLGWTNNSNQLLVSETAPSLAICALPTATPAPSAAASPAA